MERLVINDCKVKELNSFISRLKKINELTFKGHIKSSENVFQERYTFKSDYENISIVFETKSHNLIITASEHILMLLRLEFDNIKKNLSEEIAPPKLTHKENPKLTHKESPKLTHKENPKLTHKESPKLTHKEKSKPIHKETHKEVRKETHKEVRKEIHKEIHKEKSTPSAKSDTQKVIHKQKEPSKKIPQEVKKISKDAERKLKKLLPNAFDFLSDRAKMDFIIGMNDISNSEVKLSDYSMLLMPPYRALERLIFDLQRSKNIEVKMIGQAYEKLDGKYILKAGYRKRIRSIIYNEVMSALYTEYFEKRNFYSHSDITGDSLSRIISDKNSVKNIFDNLISIIEYNVAKLKEINFALLSNDTSQK